MSNSALATTNPGINKQEYKALLLIYASYVDLEFTGDEKAEIINNYGYETFEKANSYYSSMREYELLKNICDLRQLYYPGPDGKVNVLNMIRKHFHSDGDYSQLERSQYNFLRMML